VAISLLVWVGGTIGGVIDNIPFTQTMIPVVARLASSDMGLPLTPLVWALVFGCCLGGTQPPHVGSVADELGRSPDHSDCMHDVVVDLFIDHANTHRTGNATLIGAPANIVAAGLAEQQGYKLTFMHFFRIGFPCCLLSLFIANAYLLVTHVLIPWY
jgi:Na+/H+ antiporter NhaD/arsenite permease-like protein